MNLALPDIEIVEETIVDDHVRPECFWHSCGEQSTQQALLSCSHTAGFCDPHAKVTQERVASPSWVMVCSQCGANHVTVVAWL